MADKSQTLAEQYFVKDKQEKTDTGPNPNPNPVEVKEVETPKEAAVEKTAEQTPAVAEGSSEVTTTPPTDQSNDPTPDASEEVSNDAATEQSSGNTEEENASDQDAAAEEAPQIKLETAPADFRFPTTNQTRHCFTRYIEYHRCIAAKGEDAPECEKFAKYHRSLCPGEWIERWNEQRENGTFPGPL